MSKPKEDKVILGSIVLIVIAIVISILAILLTISMWMLSTGNYMWDVSNWFTMLIEIGIGIGIAIIILVYERNQQKKFQLQQDKISELVNEIKNLTEEQKRFREGRHRWAIVLLNLELQKIKFLIDKEPYQGIYQDAQVIANSMEQIINQSGDIIEPHFIHDINAICNVIHDNTDGKKFVTEDLFSNPQLQEIVNRLISDFERIYPSV